MIRGALAGVALVGYLAGLAMLSTEKELLLAGLVVLIAAASAYWIGHRLGIRIANSHRRMQGEHLDSSQRLGVGARLLIGFGPLLGILLATQAPKSAVVPLIGGTFLVFMAGLVGPPQSYKDEIRSRLKAGNSG